MNFKKLHELIPYAKGGKKHVLTMQPYNGITLALPGRHAEDTNPKGGDFVVMVDDEGLDWTKHQFTHVDLFGDLENKRNDNFANAKLLLEDYYKVVTGTDPDKFDWSSTHLVGLHPETFLYAVQCLAVAEHRRYHQYEEKFGGRYLPFRFASGIVEGKWTAAKAAEIQRRGRPGVEMLERLEGTPTLTKDLLS